jgi:SulP family sulfate permease
MSGLLGAGFTGSYIFSQSIFTLRARVHNRLNGWTVVVLELALCLVPFSVVRIVISQTKSVKVVYQC